MEQIRVTRRPRRHRTAEPLIDVPTVPAVRTDATQELLERINVLLGE